MLAKRSLTPQDLANRFQWCSAAGCLDKEHPDIVTTVLWESADYSAAEGAIHRKRSGKGPFGTGAR